MTAGPQYRIWHSGLRTRRMASVSSETRRSAHLLRFVNSKVAFFCWDGRATDRDWDCICSGSRGEE